MEFSTLSAETYRCLQLPIVQVLRLMQLPYISPCYALMTHTITPVLYMSWLLDRLHSRSEVGHQVDVNMAILYFCILLVVFCVTGGISKTSADSFCSYTFKVPATECGPSTVDDRFMKSSITALQTQINLVMNKQTEEISKLRTKIASIEKGNTETQTV